MTFQFPWMLIAVFMALAIFMYHNQKIRIRREEKRDARMEHNQEILENLLKHKEVENKNHLDNLSNTK